MHSMANFVQRAALALATCCAGAAVAADPITVIWPAPAGGGGDLYFRVLARVIERDFAVPVVVSNISGAGGSIGVARMVGAKPDGNTLAGAWTGPISIAPHTLGVSYTPADYIPIMLFSSAPYVLCTQAAFPANSGAELLEVLKKSPNKYTFGTDGPGGMGQLAAVRIFRAAGVSQRDIPYKGAGESSVALMGGHVDMYAGTIPTILKFVQPGAVKCLLVAAAARAASLPGTQSLTDVGMPKEETALWRALFAPRGTAPERIAQLEKMFEAAARSPEGLKFLQDVGETLEIFRGRELAERLRQEYEGYAAVVKAVGLGKP